MDVSKNRIAGLGLKSTMALVVSVLLFQDIFRNWDLFNNFIAGILGL